VKQTSLERRRFAVVVWNDLLRWAMLIFIVASALSAAVCLHFHIALTFLLFFVEFLISLAVAWVFLFIRKPVNPEFLGDK
jgi:hypothetical protein